MIYFSCGFVCLFVLSLKCCGENTNHQCSTNHSALIQVFLRVIHPCASSSFQSRSKVRQFDIQTGIRRVFSSKGVVWELAIKYGLIHTQDRCVNFMSVKQTWKVGWNLNFITGPWSKDKKLWDDLLKSQ